MSDPNIVDSEMQKRRAIRKWTRKENLGRIAWQFASPFFRFSPRLAWGWRRWLLKCFGARIGQQVNIYPNCRILIPWNLDIGDWSTVGDGAILYALGPIKIGRHVTISQEAHLCAGTHDYESPHFDLLKLPISIDDYSWICAEAFIGPDLTIGEGAVVAARAMVVKSVSPWQIVGGNPARTIKERKIRFGSNEVPNETETKE